MTEYAEGRIYPGSVPEFRQLQKTDGTMEMQVRYINTQMGYTGKWMPVKTEKEEIAQAEIEYAAWEIEQAQIDEYKQAAINAKQSALSKLTALGLTEEEALSLGVK